MLPTFLRRASVLWLVFTASLFADIVSFTGLPADSERGTYNGFASGTIDGSPFNDLICDDYSHITYVPSGGLDYNVSTLDSLQYARFVSPGGPKATDIANYEAAAILVQGLIDNPGQVADYQYALWELFTPTASNYYPGANALLTNALNLVQVDASGYTDLFSKLRVYTPAANFASNQEFLEIDPPATVPEPASVILLLTGVAFILAGRMRRRVRRADG